MPDDHQSRAFDLVAAKRRQRCFLQALFRRAQLKALVDAHGLKEGLGGNLSHDEVTVIRGALDLTHKTAADCMTPLDKVYPPTPPPQAPLPPLHTCSEVPTSEHTVASELTVEGEL